VGAAIATPSEEAEVEKTVITPAGLERVRAELEQLETEGRRAIISRLQHAVDEANLAQSADYHTAREDQLTLERRIALLDERLRYAQVVEPELGNGRLDVGERARLRDLASGEDLELMLVGPLEADASAGRISTASPLGSAILGRRRGEVAQIDAPRGTLRFELLEVEAACPEQAA
jgi:transcription elongation factor GreA